MTARVHRLGSSNRMIVRNSKVYAAPLIYGDMNGLFAYRDLEPGEILVQYTGDVLSQAKANVSTSEYLFDLFYRSRAGAATVYRKTIDGRGELAGFANYAPSDIANAHAVDLLPTIIDNEIEYAGRHALVLVAKNFIPLGTEIRFDYNADQDENDGDMVRMMKKKYGLTVAQMNDTGFLTTTFVTPPERNHSGMIEPDFEFGFLSDVV